MATSPLIPGVNGLPKVILSDSGNSRADVYLHGAHVTSWIPAGDEERLFLSSASEFRDGAAIRGGVPVVFPQFSGWGPLPKHGFARNRAWELIGADAGSARFQLRDSDATRAIWPHAFLAEFMVAVPDRMLVMELVVANRGEESFSFTAALHTYLRVDDIASTQIENLRGLKYFDAVLKQEALQTEDTLAFPSEIDRVYFGATKVIVRDGRRSLEVQNVGFPDGVIWNPGAKLAATLSDLDPDGYRHFVCVEAAIFREPITLGPYQMWRGGQLLTSEPTPADFVGPVTIESYPRRRGGMTLTSELTQSEGAASMDQQREENIGSDLWGEARVSDVLAAKRRHLIVAAAPTDRVRAIIERLKIHEISQMPVLDDGKLIGLITESTLLAHLAVPGHSVDDAIAPMVNQQVTTVAPDRPAQSLLNLFGGSQAVIVVENDRVTGILTKLDLIEYLTARLRQSSHNRTASA